MLGIAIHCIQHSQAMLERGYVSLLTLSFIVYYSNDDQGRVYQNCKFHISHYSEYVLSSLSVYFTLIVIVLKDYNAAFYTIVDFY